MQMLAETQNSGYIVAIDVPELTAIPCKKRYISYSELGSVWTFNLWEYSIMYWFVLIVVFVLLYVICLDLICTYCEELQYI